MRCMRVNCTLCMSLMCINDPLFVVSPIMTPPTAPETKKLIKNTFFRPKMANFSNFVKFLQMLHTKVFEDAESNGGAYFVGKRYFVGHKCCFGPHLENRRKSAFFDFRPIFRLLSVSLLMWLFSFIETF